MWVEGALGPVERACIRSILKQGHRIDLWHYGPLSGVPDGVTLRDGPEVIPRERLIRHVPSGSYALFANLFHYELLRQERGLWMDCDCYLLKPVRLGDGHVYGWGEPGIVASGLLGLPADSPVLSELIGYFEARRIPPWLPLRWRIRYFWQRALRGRFRIETMPWGFLGPYALTPLLHQYGLIGKAKAMAVYYPWSWREAHWVYEAGMRLEDRIAPDTIALHLYNEIIRDRKHEPPAPGSFMERLHREGA